MNNIDMYIMLYPSYCSYPVFVLFFFFLLQSVLLQIYEFTLHIRIVCCLDTVVYIQVVVSLLYCNDTWASFMLDVKPITFIIIPGTSFSKMPWINKILFQSQLLLCWLFEFYIVKILKILQVKIEFSQIHCLQNEH